MTTDRERWDAKYEAARDRPLDPPDDFVVHALDRLELDGVPLGTAVDVAAGRGRHALELARRGWRATAWDVSPVGLAALERAADDSGRAVTTRAIDLLGTDLPAGESFDLVVIVNFLDRPLLDRLDQLVRPAGHALVTTFTTERPGTRPPLDFCLEPGELERRFGSAVVLSREQDGRAGVLVRF